MWKTESMGEKVERGGISRSPLWEEEPSEKKKGKEMSKGRKKERKKGGKTLLQLGESPGIGTMLNEQSNTY